MGRSSPVFTASARIFPTEDPVLVYASVTNLFPDSTLTAGEDQVKAAVSGIDHLVRLVTEQKTRYSFLEAVSRGCEGNRFRVTLNKQAASVSRVNLVDEPRPLGWIEFSGVVDNPVEYFEKMLDIPGYITSRTGRREVPDVNRPEVD